MAADVYIQTALTHLQSAIGDIQTQMHSMQHDIDEQKRQLDDDVRKFDHERRQHEIEITHLDSDSQRRVLMARISQLNHASDDRKGKMSQVDSEFRAVLQRKTQLYNNLSNLMSQLNQYLASPDLR